MQRHVVVGAIRQYQAIKDRCIDLGSHAFESSDIHKVFIDMSLYNNFNEENKADVL